MGKIYGEKLQGKFARKFGVKICGGSYGENVRGKSIWKILELENTLFDKSRK